MMSEQSSIEPSEPRPRFQFSLRTLIGVVTGCCLLCSAVAWAGGNGVLLFFGAGGLFLLVVGVYRKRAELAVGGVVLWIVAAVAWPALRSTHSGGVGQRNVPITVTVVDLSTNTPIGGATVCFRPHWVSGTAAYSSTETAADGAATLTLQLERHYECVQTPLRGTEEQSWFVFAWSAIEVEARGYRDTQVTLFELVRAETWQEDQLPLPTVTIKISPK